MNSFRSAVFFCVLLLLTVVMCGCPSDMIFIHDNALDGAIRAQIGKPFGILTKYDLLQVQTLDARALGIRSISGLEYCKNLRWLDLDTNDISDITPLEMLGRPEDPFASPLVYINLDGNEITDISPLQGLLNLSDLSLFDNQISDITPLVANADNGGLGTGDSLILDYRHLSAQAISVDVPYLTDKGVQVTLGIPEDSGEDS